MRPEIRQGPDKPVSDGTNFRRAARWLVLLTAIIYGEAFFVHRCNINVHSPELYGLALQHFSATIRLSSAALAALCLVRFLENTSLAIEFEAIGLKFKGLQVRIVMCGWHFLP